MRQKRLTVLYFEACSQLTAGPSCGASGWHSATANDASTHSWPVCSEPAVTANCNFAAKRSSWPLHTSGVVPLTYKEQCIKASASVYLCINCNVSLQKHVGAGVFQYHCVSALQGICSIYLQLCQAPDSRSMTAKTHHRGPMVGM